MLPSGIRQCYIQPATNKNPGLDNPGKGKREWMVPQMQNCAGSQGLPSPLVCAGSGAAAADPRLPTYRNTFLTYAAGAAGILALAQIADAARA